MQIEIVNLFNYRQDNDIQLSNRKRKASRDDSAMIIEEVL